MTYSFCIYGTLPSLNEYIEADRKSRYIGNRMKQDSQKDIQIYIRRFLKSTKIENPVFIIYRFYEPNKKRDLDNVAGYAHKVIQDALVQCGVLKNDGWANIDGFSDYFFLDRDNPRIVVEIVEKYNG